jgi:hypothetical protein
MKTPLITFLIAGFLLVLASCRDFLDQKPPNEEIVGKWEVTWIAPSVAGWIVLPTLGCMTEARWASLFASPISRPPHPPLRPSNHQTAPNSPTTVSAARLRDDDTICFSAAT